MTNILLPLAVSCLLWAPVYVRAAAPPVATCQAAVDQAAAQTQIYKMQTLAVVRITCPANTNLANVGAAAANGPTAGVYANTAAAQTVALNTVLVGATYVRANANDDFTVSQLPANDVTVYFRCNGAGGNPSCWIGVQVAAQPALGPQGCTVGGSEVTLSVTEANQTAQFICADGKVVLPASAANAYDSDCKTEVGLTTVLPGATFTRGDAGVMNALKVSALPDAAKGICYVCATNAQSQANDRCSVKVTVAGKQAGGNGAIGLTARSAAALGVLLIGAALFQQV